jgi:NAD+ synthase (glutamine-hydrolysing)
MPETQTLRIALCQINTTVGDLAGNCRKVVEGSGKAREAGADLVVFPELTITGYPPEDLLLKPGFIKANAAALDSLTQQLRGPVVCVGFAEPGPDGVPYNSLALIQDGEILHVYRKMALPNYGVFDEKRYFNPGLKPLLFNLKGKKICVTVCEDTWVDHGPAEALIKSGRKPDVVINASASPYFRGRIRDRITLLKRKAKLYKCPVCLCNLVGGQDELVFDGGSLAVGPDGRILCRAAQFREDLSIFTLGPKGTAEKKPASIPLLSPVEEVYQALVAGTRDYVEKNGFKKVVLGLSGGIDSAVVAAIAVAALGPDRVKGVTMPSEFSSKETYEDSLLLAKNLGIECKIIPIKNIYTAYLEDFKSEFKDRPFDITEENLQARIRGNILMALSNKYGWLVLTTGNKSEMSAGYSTLYGDMAGGFAVIKDVYKTLVYEVAGFINKDGEKIPQSVIDRPPTAELRPNQKDQDTLPPYETLDAILSLYIEADASVESIMKKGFDRGLVEKICRMVDRNEYKRRQAAIGVKITPKSFGRDRRMPVVNRFEGVRPAGPDAARESASGARKPG